MKRMICGFLCSLLLILAACGSKKNGQPPEPQGNREEFEQFLTVIGTQEEPWTKEELQTYVSYLQPSRFEHAFGTEEIQELAKSKKSPETVTVQQAAEDVNLAFELLAYAYGGYHYFGGDEVFLPIRDSILTRLDSMQKIKTSDLWDLLWEAVSPVVKDRHFYIATDRVQNHTFEREFSQSAYFVQDLYFNDPTGVDSQYVKRTIGPDGALTYCLAAVCRNSENLPKTMMIEGVEHSLSWSFAQPTVYESDKIEKVFSETIMADGWLPVLRNYSLFGSERRMEKFAATGSSYKKKPLFVLDLRGNSGGNDGYALLWLKNLCGRRVTEKKFWSKRLSNFTAVVHGESVDSNSGKWRFVQSDGTPWETDNLIFVLVDGNTASSGESFANMLTLGKRVVLVGTNTMGCLNFGNIGQLYLPNSGISLVFGANCSFFQSLEKTEGIGYFPDLWVEPEDSLDAVVRLCNYYGLFAENSK